MSNQPPAKLATSPLRLAPRRQPEPLAAAAPLLLDRWPSLCHATAANDASLLSPAEEALAHELVESFFASLLAVPPEQRGSGAAEGSPAKG